MEKSGLLREEFHLWFSFLCDVLCQSVVWMAQHTWLQLDTDDREQHNGLSHRACLYPRPSWSLAEDHPWAGSCGSTAQLDWDRLSIVCLILSMPVVKTRRSLRYMSAWQMKLWTKPPKLFLKSVSHCL